MNGQNAQLMQYIVPVLVIALILRRNLAERQLQVDRMWVFPLILVAAIGYSIFSNPPTTMIAYAVMAVGFALGCATGFFRGRFTNIMVNPETHDLTSKGSPIGIIFIAVVFAARFGLRYYLQQNGAHGALGGVASAITDGLLVFSVGMMSTTRLEMWIRARRLLAEAIAAKAARSVS
jgi:hypothetical protein